MEELLSTICVQKSVKILQNRSMGLAVDLPISSLWIYSPNLFHSNLITFLAIIR